MKLRIKRRSQSEWLVHYVFALPFAFFLLMDVLFVPAIIKYSIDFALALLLLLGFLNKRTIDDPQTRGIAYVVLAFIAVTVVGLFLEYQSILYYLWGMRNNIRFFVFFFMCVTVLKQEGADSCIKLIDGLFYINLIVTLYQSFVLHAHQDRIGGIFGNSRGCNAYTNIYLMIIVAWHMLRYMNHKETFLMCMIKCGFSLLIAALSELKVFFLEFVIITALATMITKFSLRKFWVIIGASAGLVIGIQIVKTLFPYFADWFQLETILSYASADTGYTNANDLNRLSAMTIVWNRFLETWPQKLLGLGLGNCDYSSNFDFLTTPFYMMNADMNYTWFSSAFLLLETGLIGFLLHIFFYIRVYFAARTVEKSGVQQPIYCQIARIMALMGPLLIIYNSSLRMECAYMYYFVLALPFLRQPAEKIAENKEQ